MSDQPTSRKELYQRIRTSSKDEVILEEMIRLGFWPANSDDATLATEYIRRESELQRELSEMMKKQQKLKNREFALQEIRKQRMADAKARREETKERREAERRERAVAWQKRKSDEILYLGEGVSFGLQDTEPTPPQRSHKPSLIDKYKLPHVMDASSMAAAMELSVRELRFLSFHRKTSQTIHYRRFTMAKKSGGQRLISAPMPRLKQAQYWILENVLNKIPSHPSVHGFRKEHSIVSNAQPHVGQDVVINLDLQDFFPTVTYRRVKGLFCRMGYSEHAATIFALLCTEPEVDPVELDGEVYYVAKGPRHLPQGAPTSPALTNILCYRLDHLLHNLASLHDYQYTRYADDITLSTSGDGCKRVGKMLKKSAQMIGDAGFVIHPNKTRIMRKGSRQEVTGIIVNDELSVDRRTLRRFRATLFQIEKDGPEGKHWGHSDNLFSAIRGFANFVAMVNPEKGTPLVEQVSRITTQYPSEAPKPTPRSKPATPKKDASTPEDPNQEWWKLW